MIKRLAFFFIAALAFFTIIYLFHLLIIDEKLYSILFSKRVHLFIFLASLFCFFYVTFLLLLWEKQKVAILSKTIKDKDKMIDIQGKEFQEKLDQEIKISQNKDKLVYEDLKIVSMKELIKNISHQYRQPLSVISTAATALKMFNEKKLLDEHKLYEACTLVNKNVQYLSSILDGFDTLNCQRIKKSIFRLSEIKYRINSFTSGYDQSLDINIQIQIKDDISVLSFKSELIQVILNIINNSREALERKKIQGQKQIQITMDSDNTHYIISIKDNAGGIEEDIIHRVFEPYFTTKHQGRGVGLGLYIGYVLVTQRLGGEVVVVNIPDGCEFTLRIPKS